LRGHRKHRFFRSGLIKSRTDGRYSCSGTGIAASTFGACDNPASGDATTIDNPTSSSSSTSASASGSGHNPASGDATTVNNPTCCSASASTYDPSFTCPCATRNICFSTLNDNPCAQYSWSIALSKKTVASYASSARFANATTLNPDHANPFSPRSGSAFRASCGPGTSPGNSPFYAGKGDCPSHGFRRCLQFR